MPLLGAHMSIAGGLHKAVEAAAALGMETVQIFTHSPSQWAVKPVAPTAKELHRDGKSLTKNASQWQGKPLTDEQIRVFKKSVNEAKLQFVTAHDSYLINLAAPGDELFEKSVNAFVDELERAEKLGLSYLVTHPGAHVGSGEADGLKRVIQGLNLATERTRGFKVLILLENTAGQGTTLGCKLEHLATLLQGVKEPERFGICLDTCHAFAAGYDLAQEKPRTEFFAAFTEQIGLERLMLFHLNDSVKGLGSRVDRHAGLGLGKIGLGAFRSIVTDPRFQHLPMILETPKESDDGEAMDPVNLGILREFLGDASELAG